MKNKTTIYLSAESVKSKQFTDVYTELQPPSEHIADVYFEGLPLTDLMRELGITGAWRDETDWVAEFEGHPNIRCILPIPLAEKLGVGVI
jgi:hypothetical protein